MNEVNLLHYIQSGDFVDQLIENQTYSAIYADVGHLFPNCTPLSQLDASVHQSTLIILSRLTVVQFFEMYDVSNLTQITIVNLRVGVAGIGHKFVPEFDDIALMTGYGWRVYEPVSLSDLDQVVHNANQPTYVRITHRYLPHDLGLKPHDGLWYQGELSQNIAIFPASMIEAVGGLDPESQSSQHVLVSDWSNRYLSGNMALHLSTGANLILTMEQSLSAVDDYVDMITSLYPKVRMLGVSLGSDIREGDIIVDEYRDQWYGCDSQGIGQKL